MGNPLYFLFWLIVFFFISFWVGYIGACLYVWFFLFSKCCGCEKCVNFLLKCAQFPGYCWASMVSCKKPC